MVRPYCFVQNSPHRRYVNPFIGFLCSVGWDLPWHCYQRVGRSIATNRWYRVCSSSIWSEVSTLHRQGWSEPWKVLLGTPWPAYTSSYFFSLTTLETPFHTATASVLNGQLILKWSLRAQPIIVQWQRNSTTRSSWAHKSVVCVNPDDGIYLHNSHIRHLAMVCR